MLSGLSIKQSITDNEIFETNDSIEESRIIENIQNASIDLTAKYMFSAKKNIFLTVADNLKKFAFDSYELKPGETVIVEVAEKFSLANDIGGIIFPPNSLAKNGIIMTNPGHIDPGFNGFISVCLVNMGRDNFKLKSNSIIATLILNYIEGEPLESEVAEGKGVNKSQLRCMGKDFAGLDERIPKIVKKSITAFSIGAIVFVATILTLIALAVPEITRYRMESISEGNNYLKSLSLEVESVKEKLINKNEQIADLERKLTEQKTALLTIQNKLKNTSKLNLQYQNKIDSKIKKMQEVQNQGKKVP